MRPREELKEALRDIVRELPDILSTLGLTLAKALWFNNTSRQPIPPSQRIPRLTRKPLGFSKSLDHPPGAIRLFVRSSTITTKHYLLSTTRRRLIWQKSAKIGNVETTLDRFGRVLIPKKLRERLGLEPYDALELQLEDGKLTLLPRRTPPPLRRKGRVLVVESEASSDLSQALTRLREERLDELSQ